MNPFYENPSKAEGYSLLTKAMDKDKVNNAEIKRAKSENLKRMQKRIHPQGLNVTSIAMFTSENASSKSGKNVI